MNRIRITPFMIVMPIVFIWSGLLVMKTANADGMGVLMVGFYAWLMLVSASLFVIDRLISGRANLWWLAAIEVLVLVVSWYLINWYLYS